MSDNRLNIPKMEEDVLKFWKENNIFEKSIEIREGAPDFVFYDGPPFANGLPHNGHILSSVSKDLVGRYKTMRGFHVERRWGWDCHGLPVENAIEKELGLNGRKEIEDFGIDKFNNACEISVMKYDKEWERQVERWGRFVDFKRNYKTMDKNFMESVWWGFKQLFDKGYVYEDTRISLYCPRCETPLSNFEIAMDNSYKKVTDPSIYVKFKLEGRENEYLLIWTTTPWTLPSNSAVAVHPRLEYCKVKVGNESYWVAMSLVDTIFGDVEHEASECHKGEELIGWKYQPVFDYFKATKKNTYTVVAGEFVTTTDGTGMVHIAPTFGDDDFKIGKEYDLDFIESVNQQGKFTDLVSKFAGKNVWNINQNVLEYLKEAGAVYKVLPITHEYPFCYRCDTKLIYKTQPAWYIKVSAFKDKMLKANEQIKWHPEHLQKGRFGHGLETAPDWNVSRSRFWGNAIPVWKHTKTGDLKVFGSIKELEEASGMKVENLHRPEIDQITWKDGEGEYVRVGEVFDCWFESGSMPWASVHYPFENKEWFEKNYPAEFISEYIAQTRGWFYTMHVLAVGIFDKPSFIHAVTTGTILAKDGQKMSKSKKNYTDPMELINKYGVDSMRYYLMSSPLMNAENLNYKDEEHADAFRKINLLTWNVYTFFATYSNLLKSKELVVSDNLLDKWILSRLNLTVKEITESYDNYDITRGTREIGSFIDELSTWYLRRSRDRFKNDKDEKDQQAVLNTMYNVLLTLSKILAPVAPFMAEELYQKLGGVKQSVHLDEWPEFDPNLVDTQVLNDMETSRLLIEKSLAIRSTNGVKIRQALGVLYINKVSLPKEYHAIIADEVNVKEVMATKDLPVETDLMKVNADEDIKVALDLTITEELRREGDFRELTRAINNYRKELKLTPADIVSLSYDTDSSELSELIEQTSSELMEATRLKKVEKSGEGEMVEVDINGKKLKIKIEA